MDAAQVEVTTPAVVYDFKVQHMGCRAKPHEMVTLGIMQGRMEKDAGTNVDNCFTVRDFICCLHSVGRNVAQGPLHSGLQNRSRLCLAKVYLLN